MLSQICLPAHSFSPIEGPRVLLCLQPPPRHSVLPLRAAQGPQVQFQLQSIILPHPPMKERYPHPLNAFFLFNGTKIRYERKPLPSIRYRQPHKRALNSKAQSSAIYKHGTQLTTNGDSKFWLCKYCHTSGQHDSALYNSEGTTSIMYHLKHQHKLQEFGYKPVASNPFNMARGVTSSIPYLGGRRLVFNDLQFQGRIH